jgi:hypothetical protein
MSCLLITVSKLEQKYTAQGSKLAGIKMPWDQV